MLSKAQIKFIQSLRIKKFREEHNSFLAEGEKLAEELLSSTVIIKDIYATEHWLNGNHKKIKKETGLHSVSEGELKRISSLSTPNEVLIVAETPMQKLWLKHLPEELSLVLDDIRDPGNLGTIIRVADWFGIKNIICSNETADAFNPKVVQATMGSVIRVNVFYSDLVSFFREPDLKGIPVYGALLEGENIYQSKLSATGLILIGNESRGISKELLPFISKKIYIPPFGPSTSSGQDLSPTLSPSTNDQGKAGEGKRSGAESLNAAVAAAVICSEFRRAC